MIDNMEQFVEGLELDEEEIQERLKKALGDFDVQDFLTDVMLFDYLIKKNGVVTITQEDMEKIEDIRRTRSIEFISDMDKDGNRVMIARLLYTGKGKEKEDEAVSDND